MTQLIRALVLSVGLAAVVVPAASAQGRYTMTRSGDVVELQDTQAVVSEGRNRLSIDPEALRDVAEQL